MIKGRLPVARPMLKLFLSEYFGSSDEIGSQSGGFLRKDGPNFQFWFCDPEKEHPCAKRRPFTYFASKSACATWLWVTLRTQKIAKSTLVPTGSEIAHAQRRTLCSDLDSFAE